MTAVAHSRCVSSPTLSIAGPPRSTTAPRGGPQPHRLRLRPPLLRPIRRPSLRRPRRRRRRGTEVHGPSSCSHLRFSHLLHMQPSKNRQMSISLCVRRDRAVQAHLFIYVLSFLHIVHLVAGLIVLIVLMANTKRGKYVNDNLGFNLGSNFWHFLDFLWVYLFCFFYFFG